MLSVMVSHEFREGFVRVVVSVIVSMCVRDVVMALAIEVMRVAVSTRWLGWRISFSRHE